MKKAASLIATAAFALSAIAAAPAAQEDREFDHTVDLVLNNEIQSVDGGVPGGVNVNYFDIAPGTLPGGCSKEATNYCELVELRIDTTGLHAVDDNGTPDDETDDTVADLRIFGSIDLASTQPAADFDLDVYHLNEDGTDGDQVGQSGRTPVADTDANGYDENVPLNLTIKGEDAGVQRFVVKVVYFAAPSTYRLDIYGRAF